MSRGLRDPLRRLRSPASRGAAGAAFAVGGLAIGGLAAGCSSASHPAAATTTTARPGTTISVWVATREIPRCTSADDALGQGLLTVGAISTAAAPAGAVVSGSQLGGRWFSRSIAPHAIVTTADVAKPPVAGC